MAEHAEREAYERHIATSHGLDMSALAALGSLEHQAIGLMTRSPHPA